MYMPAHTRKTQTPRRIDVSTKILGLQKVRAARKKFVEDALPTRIKNTPAKTALIGYVLRILDDRSRGVSLTALQKRIVGPIVRARIDTKIVKRFGSMPADVQTSLKGNFFNVHSGAAVDAELHRILDIAAKEVGARNRNYVLGGGFKDLTVIGNMQGSSSPPTRAKQYHFQLTYRGLEVHNGGDRFGTGVDPYFVAGFCRKPWDSPVALTLIDPRVYKHEPHDLCENDAGHWHPCGGGQDSNGDPSSPLYTFPQLSFVPGTSPWHPLTVIGDDIEESTPLLNDKDLYYSLVSVWEQDGDSSAELRQNMGALLIEVGTALLPEFPVVGGVVVVSGAILELSAFATGAADDPVGDLMLVFSKSDLEQQAFREIACRVSNSESGLDWTLYFGVNTRQAT
jgi:hypothetical protein